MRIQFIRDSKTGGPSSNRRMPAVCIGFKLEANGQKQFSWPTQKNVRIFIYFAEAFGWNIMREQPVPAVGRIKLFTMRSICTLSTGLLLYVIILDSTELLFDRQLIWINSPHPMIKRKTVATVLSSPRFRFSGVIGPILFLKSPHQI